MRTLVPSGEGRLEHRKPLGDGAIVGGLASIEEGAHGAGELERALAKRTVGVAEQRQCGGVQLDQLHLETHHL